MMFEGLVDSVDVNAFDRKWSKLDADKGKSFTSGLSGTSTTSLRIPC